MSERVGKRSSQWIPSYAIIPLIFCLMVNTLVYNGSMKINSNRYHYDFTTSFDQKVPLIPSFLIIYFGCYLFWAVNYILIAKQGKEHFYRFQVADVLSRIVCFIFYVFLPTTNIRPEIVGDDIFMKGLQWLWQIDPANNLFPSIHCLVSWFCYIGIRGQKKVPKWYRVASCIFALLVFISTQVTKQHYIVDVFGGVILAEVSYFIGRKTSLYRLFWRFFDRINRWLGIEESKDTMGDRVRDAL